MHCLSVSMQMTDMKAMQASSNSRSKQQDSRISSLQASLQLTETNLSASRGREQALEKELTAALHRASQAGGEGGAPEQQGDVGDEEEGMVVERSVSTEYGTTERCMRLEGLLDQAQQRCAEVESELKDAKVNMDDLIMEIEGVAMEEEKTRTQNSRLLQQLAEVQSQQKGVVQENLRLHQQIASLQEREIELRQR